MSLPKTPKSMRTSVTGDSGYTKSLQLPVRKRTGAPATLKLSPLITPRLPYVVPTNYRTGTKLIFLRDEGMFFAASFGNCEYGNCWYWDAVTPAYAIRMLKDGEQLLNIIRKEELVMLTKYEKFDTGYAEHS